MYMFELWDGTVLGTTSSYMIPQIQEDNRGEIRLEWFCEDLDRAIDQVDFVIE